MNISVSNLSWIPNDLDVSLDILKKFNIHHIEGIFTKINNWENIKDSDIKFFKKKCSQRNIQVSSFQSIFYQTSITSFSQYKKVFNHLSLVEKLASKFESKILVLGSPTLRKIDSLLNLYKSLKFIDPILQKNKMIMCIEPNSKIYGGNYFYSLEEICKFIKDNKFKNIKSMIDTHNLIEEGFDLIDEYVNYIDYIYHVHISEKSLDEIKKPKKYRDFIIKLKESYNGLIVYEFKNCKNFEKAIELFINMF